MAKLKVSDEWWTCPAEAENGKLIMVTGRANMEEIIATGKYNTRVEITWKYEVDKDGMPDVATSSLMEEVQDALQADFMKDPVAVLTGIYTGNGERTWVFYVMSVKIFETAASPARHARRLRTRSTPTRFRKRPAPGNLSSPPPAKPSTS